MGCFFCNQMKPDEVKKSECWAVPPASTVICTFCILTQSRISNEEERESDWALKSHIHQLLGANSKGGRLLFVANSITASNRSEETNCSRFFSHNLAPPTAPASFSLTDSDWSGHMLTCGFSRWICEISDLKSHSLKPEISLKLIFDSTDRCSVDVTRRQNSQNSLYSLQGEQRRTHTGALLSVAQVDGKMTDGNWQTDISHDWHEARMKTFTCERAQQQTQTQRKQTSHTQQLFPRPTRHSLASGKEGNKWNKSWILIMNT